jgi:hypothetical protein
MSQADQPAPEYFRVLRDDRGVIQTVETALVRLAPAQPGAGPTVDLVGVLHIADRTYYETLQGELERYDAVLFEGILPRRALVPVHDDKSPFAVMCRGIARRLGLEYQLDRLDYARPNFVHADMLQSEFRRSIRRRKESFLGVAPSGEYGLSREEMDKAISDGMTEFCRRFVSEEPAVELKRAFAHELVSAIGATMDMFFGTQGSTIGSERNRIALRVLQKQWKKGMELLALLYGCAHMADFERQLGEQYGLKRAEERWLVAWDLREPPAADFAGFRS